MQGICEIYCAETAPLSRPERFREALDRVPESRQRKVLSLRHAESRCLSLGAGLLLVLALETRGIDGRTVRIAEGPYGKPYLQDFPGLHFSLSHSGKWVMCALSDAPVGCDVEQIARGTEKLAGRFFHPAEQAALAAAGPENGEARRREFTRIWTRKESYVKATGTGISVPLEKFSALNDSPEVHYLDVPGTDPDYCFSCCALGGENGFPEWRPAGKVCLCGAGGAGIRLSDS